MYYDYFGGEDSYRFFNALMVKMAYDFFPENTNKRFKKISLDTDPTDVFCECFRAIAPGTRVYYRDNFERNYDWGAYATIILKSASIEQIFDLRRRLKNRMKKNPVLKYFYNELCSSLQSAYNWLASLEREGAISVQFLRGDKGIINRVRIDSYVLGETEILHGIIHFLKWIETGINKVLSNEEVRRMVYDKL